MSDEPKKKKYPPTQKSRVTCYMTDIEKDKWDKLCSDVGKSSGTVLTEFMNHYGKSYKDKILKQL